MTKSPRRRRRSKTTRRGGKEEYAEVAFQCRFRESNAISLINMDGQSLQNTSQWMPTSFDGNANNVSHLAENVLYHIYTMEAGGNGFRYVSPALLQRMQCQKTAQNEVKFLAASGASEIQGEKSYSSSGMTSSSTNLCLDKDPEKGGHPSPQNGAPINNFTSVEHHVQGQGTNERHSNASAHHPKACVAKPGFPPNPHSRQKAITADRRRRMRIAESLYALRELLPHSNVGNRADLVDDIIAHIKYLQILVKGYGHYLLHEEMLNEPLEEVMGKFLEGARAYGICPLEQSSSKAASNGRDRRKLMD
ncbi:hypothetical protein RJ639_043107 [Escallonia herrerae]|uniref:BHLH domain-containing protein n=1 Tax=Escallonia herrerae TaxID=1293975 RepID=A0AA88WAE0_9ASTE|nr:hypothetical protein RJ639_043107 [Escallonia herrerae]